MGFICFHRGMGLIGGHRPSFGLFGEDFYSNSATIACVISIVSLAFLMCGYSFDKIGGLSKLDRLHSGQIFKSQGDKSTTSYYRHPARATNLVESFFFSSLKIQSLSLRQSSRTEVHMFIRQLLDMHYYSAYVIISLSLPRMRARMLPCFL
jgi:hypothetical protein